MCQRQEDSEGLGQWVAVYDEDLMEHAHYEDDARAWRDLHTYAHSILF